MDRDGRLFYLDYVKPTPKTWHFSIYLPMTDSLKVFRKGLFLIWLVSNNDCVNLKVWKPEIVEQSGTVNLFDPDLCQVVWFASLLKLRHSSLNSFSKDWWVTIFTKRYFQKNSFKELLWWKRMTHTEWLIWNILLFKGGPRLGQPGSLRDDDTILCREYLLLKIHRDAEFRIYLDVTFEM